VASLDAEAASRSRISSSACTPTNKYSKTCEMYRYAREKDYLRNKNAFSGPQELLKEIFTPWSKP
jgi:hypothetical protein